MIVVMVLSTLLTGWGSMCVSAANSDSLQQAARSTDRDSLLVEALEQRYYCSLDSDDINYQLSCINDYLSEVRRQRMNDLEAFALGQRAAFFYNNDWNDSIFNTVPRDMEIVKSYGCWPIYYGMWSYIAYSYIFQNQNSLGLRETQNMYEDAKQNGSTYGMGLARCIMGTAYANLRNLDLSIDAYQKSIDILSSLEPLPPVLPDAYTYYGNALNDHKDYKSLDKLVSNWKTMLERYIDEHDLQGNPLADTYWSYYYCACVQTKLGLGNLAEAEELLLVSRQHIKDERSYSGMQWLFYMAELRLKQKKLAEAYDYNNRRLSLLDHNSDKSDRVRILQQRAEIMKLMGNFEAAARIYEEVYTISDSLNAQDTKNKLNEMNTMYQLDEKQMENERLQMNNERLKMEGERNQFRFIIVVASVILLSLAIFLFFRIRSARRLKQAHTELQTAYDDLQAANLVIEETTAAKERIESDLRIAREIQMSMVPAKFPDRPDLDLYASMTPAKEVGGDLYGYYLEGDKLYIALGDVSGKGVPASLFMAQATRLFMTLAAQNMMPAEICTRINDALSGEDNERGMFVTMFVGLIDLTTAHLYFCNAGHNPPVLDGGFIEMIPNAPIGLWPGLEYEGEEIDSIMNKPLFIYTDGLNEAENRQQEQFTDERLLEILATRPFDSSKQTVEMLREEVEKHRDGAEPNDDLTMLCVKVTDKEL